MEQTTKLSTKFYESSLKWNIDNFLEFKQIDVYDLKSKKIEFKDTNASWMLEVYPNGKNNNFDQTNDVALTLHIEDMEENKFRFVKFEITADTVGHQFMNRSNRHVVSEKGYYTDLATTKPVVWSCEYKKISEEKLNCYSFIRQDKLSSYLCGNVLTLTAKVYIKDVTIIEEFKCES